MRTGYEISFTRYFYKPLPMRTLGEIRADILALEKETEGLLDQILGEAGISSTSTTRAKKGFDCVKTTREIRDRLSAELDGMSPEDRIQWLNSMDVADPLLRRLVNRLRQQEGRSGKSAPARSTGSPVPRRDPSAARREASDDEHRLQA